MLNLQLYQPSKQFASEQISSATHFNKHKETMKKKFEIQPTFDFTSKQQNELGSRKMC